MCQFVKSFRFSIAVPQVIMHTNVVFELQSLDPIKRTFIETLTRASVGSEMSSINSGIIEWTCLITVSSVYSFYT